MKAISLWQPWASLVAHGHKKIETRSWRCPLQPGTLLAIHAAKRWNSELAILSSTIPFVDALKGIATYGGRGWPNLPSGVIVAVVRFAECITTTEALMRPRLVTNWEGHFGNYGGGRFAWIFDRILRIDEPVREPGRQSIWEWKPPDSLTDAISDLTERPTHGLDCLAQS
jgi:hypothetical protein